MGPEIDKYLVLLEQHLLLLRALEQQMTACREEFIVMDLDGIYRRIAQQEELCRQIRSLGTVTSSLQRSWAGQLTLGQAEVVAPALSDRFRSVMRELKEAQAELGRLNRIHAAYLRRSCRTVNVLMNALGNNGLTYAPPAGVTLPAPPAAGTD